MKKLNLLFQLSTLTSLLVAGFFTFAIAQNADDEAKDQKLTIDIEVTENGKTKRITKEVDAIEGEDIEAILEDLDVLQDIDIRGTGERIEIKVKKEVNGAANKNINVQLFGDDEDDFVWISGEAEKNGPLLGVFIESYDENGRKGALVSGLVEGSAAEKAELKEDDVIIGINETAITSEKQLKEVIREYKPGDQVTVKYLRNGAELTKEITLGESKGHRIIMNDFDFNFDFDKEDFQEQLKKLEDIDFDFDFEFEEDGAFLGVTPGEKTAEGVSIGKVIEESSAEKMGLEAGDIVTALDGKSVESFDDLAKVIQEKDAGDNITIEYLREGKKGSTSGELGGREGTAFTKRIIKEMAPNCHSGSASAWTPHVVKEVNVVIELKDATKEDEALLAEPADVDFNKSLAINKIEFAPNPSDGQFNLAFDLPKKQDTRVMVFNQSGQKVYEEIMNNFSGSYRNQIDISTQPSGVYFLIIAQQDKQFTRKIVKR